MATDESGIVASNSHVLLVKHGGNNVNRDSLHVVGVSGERVAKRVGL
jgi:hypothetical protein